MSKSKRKEKFHKYLGEANTIASTLVLAAIGNAAVPLLGTIIAVPWLNYRIDRESWGKLGGKFISIVFLGIILAPLAYIAAAYNAARYYM